MKREKFFAASVRRDFGGLGLTMPSKILTPYGDLVKNFRFLKEAKILSEFFRSKLVCLIPIYVSGRPAAEVAADPVEAKNSDSGEVI